MLACTGVQGLTVRDLGGGLTQILGLTIDDWRDRGLDTIAWRVHDVEDGAIAFYCSEAMGRIDHGWEDS